MKSTCQTCIFYFLKLGNVALYLLRLRFKSIGNVNWQKNESVSDKAVCRAAPSTLGLVLTYISVKITIGQNRNHVNKIRFVMPV